MTTVKAEVVLKSLQSKLQGYDKTSLATIQVVRKNFDDISDQLGNGFLQHFSEDARPGVYAGSMGNLSKIANELCDYMLSWTTLADANALDIGAWGSINLEGPYMTALASLRNLHAEVVHTECEDFDIELPDAGLLKQAPIQDIKELVRSFVSISGSATFQKHTEGQLRCGLLTYRRVKSWSKVSTIAWSRRAAPT